MMKLGFLKYNFLLLLNILCLTALPMHVLARDLEPFAGENDSVKAIVLQQQATGLIDSGNFQEAEKALNKSNNLAMNYHHEALVARNYYLLGTIKAKTNPEMALKFFLSAAGKAGTSSDSQQLIHIYHRTGEVYFELGAYQKSLEYINKAFELASLQQDGPMLLQLTKDRAVSAFYAGNYPVSIQAYQNLYRNAVSKKVYLDQKEYLENLIQLHKVSHQYDSAIFYANKLHEILVKNEDYQPVAQLLNNIGFDHVKLGNHEQAITCFNKALESNKDYLLSSGQEAKLYANIGISYFNMDARKKALEYLLKAHDLLENLANDHEKARVENILAMAYMYSRDYYHADFYSRSSIESAKKSGDMQLLQECYHTYSLILKKGNDHIKALEYYEKHLSIRDSLLVERRLAEQEMQKRIFELEQSEKELKLALQEEQMQEMAYKQLLLEVEKEKKERELLESRHELELKEKDRLKLEKEMIWQSLELTRKENEKRELEDANRIKDLTIRHEKAAKLAKEKENQLLESENRQQELEIEKQKIAQRRATWIIGLIVMLALIITGSLINSTRKNRILANQKKLIEEKNTDLEYKNEEITAQKEEIESQKENLQEANEEINLKNADLESKNEEITAQNEQITYQKELIEEANKALTDSIQYASRIQGAVLPPLDIFEEHVPEYFVLFKPRDIVSGDFYWGTEKNGLVYIAAADCTGHGVPGAFMSMLGIAFLNEIISKHPKPGAAFMLNELRENVIGSLRQKGKEGEQKDGMDMALCIYDRDNETLHFAGANNPLYHVRDGELIKIKGNRMPIGIHMRSGDDFTEHTIKLKKGDCFYIFSDGFADQFGGEMGKKYKYKSFQEFLLKNHQHDFQMQKQLLDEEFEQWKGNIEQIDDVLVIGFRV